MIKNSLQVNTASGTALGPIGITPIELNIDDKIFVHNVIICTELKQPLILGLNFTQRYRIGIALAMYRTLFLRHEGKKIAISMKTINPEQWTIASLETPSGKPKETDQKSHLMTNHAVTIPPYHISIISLKIHQPCTQQQH